MAPVADVRVSFVSRGGLAPAGRVTLAPWLLPWPRSPRVWGPGRQARAAVTVCLDQPALGEWTAPGASCGQMSALWPRPLGGTDLESNSGCDWYCLVRTSDVPGSKCKQVSWKYQLGCIAVWVRCGFFFCVCFSISTTSKMWAPPTLNIFKSRTDLFGSVLWRLRMIFKFAQKLLLFNKETCVPSGRIR